MNIFSKSHLRKGKSSQKDYSESTLFPVLSRDDLLPEVEEKIYLKKLQDLVGVPDDHFRAVYRELIDNFVEFVQVLPESYGEDLGSLLNDGLRRGLYSVQLLNETSNTKPHPLFIFAVFSVALLSDVGHVVSSQKVMISDDKGVFLDEWCPFLGPIKEFGAYYKLRAYSGGSKALMRSSTPVIARQLLTDTGIVWLASNSRILDMWLAFLHKGEDWEGGLGKILKLEKKQFDLRSQEIGLVPIDISLLDAMGTELGEKFLAWLKEGIENGSISVNKADSHVHIVRSGEIEQGVFLEAPEIFQQFANTIKVRDWIVIYKQFNYLGLTKLSGNDYKIQQFFDDPAAGEAKRGKLGFLGEKTEGRSLLSEGVATRGLLTKSKNIKEGVVVKDAGFIFGSNKIPGQSSYLKEVEMRWMLDNTLPKIKSSEPQGPSVQIK